MRLTFPEALKDRAQYPESAWGGVIDEWIPERLGKAAVDGAETLR